MDILTEKLLAVPDRALPLPWYHRAPLGLLSGTPVHVALQKPRERPVGDLLLSVIDPANWPFVARVDAWKPDEPGVLADVYGLAPPLNIVFAEALTLDAGSRHNVRFIVEPFHPDPQPQGQQEIKELKDKVEDDLVRIKNRLLELGFIDVKSNFIHGEEIDLDWMENGRIEFGWAHVADWRDMIEAQARRDPHGDEIDSKIAVVSADTTRRLLRFLFPRRGAVSVSVEHADRPGSAREIAKALGQHDFNILSSLLRRGAAPTGKAELVAVVEPTDGTRDAFEVAPRIRKALSDFRPISRVRVKTFEAIDPASVLYPRRPQEIAVRPGKFFESAIVAARDAIPSGRRPIFVSRRFVDSADTYTHDVVEELRHAFEEHGFIAVEATPQATTEIGARDEVKARMWASDAAVLLVMSTPDERVFSENLAHEFGFMEGQGKPLLPLVEDSVAGSVIKHANLQGLQLHTFSKRNAMNRNREDSVYQVVEKWLKTLPGYQAQETTIRAKQEEGLLDDFEGTGLS